MTDTADAEIRPALIVVDMQEDFCPPKGSLAVDGGRSIAPLINKFLSSRSFVVRISTQDFHPTTHISFAANHPGPDNKPFESFVQMHNPASQLGLETKPQRLWPVHCVENSPGSAIIPEIESEKIDIFVRKGMDERMEMYSAFADAFGNDDCLETGGVNVNIEEELNARDVTDVVVLGLAGDYCVKHTALDATKYDFRVWVVEDGTKCVDSDAGWRTAKEELLGQGVNIVKSDSPELKFTGVNL